MSKDTKRKVRSSLVSQMTLSPRSKSELASTEWLRDLSAEAKELVLSQIYERQYLPGEVVARRGEVAHDWIGVAEGLLKIVAISHAGKTVMLNCIPDGAWVGEGSVLKREARKYDIVAMKASRVFHLPGPTLRWLLDTSINFNALIIAHLNERLAQYIKMMEIDRLTDPIARVARAIATLYNPVLNPRTRALLPLSQTELGELCGLSRQSVSAALKQLDAKGLLSVRYGGILVLQLEELAQYLEREAS